jgi:hypothetical protein
VVGGFGFLKAPLDFLRAAAPLSSTYITNIDVFHINRVILYKNNISLLTGSVCCARSCRTLDILHMGESWVVASEFIEKNLIAFTSALLKDGLHDKTTFDILIFIPAIYTLVNEDVLFFSRSGWCCSCASRLGGNLARGHAETIMTFRTELHCGLLPLYWNCFCAQILGGGSDALNPRAPKS